MFYLCETKCGILQEFCPDDNDDDDNASDDDNADDDNAVDDDNDDDDDNNGDELEWRVLLLWRPSAAKVGHRASSRPTNLYHGAWGGGGWQNYHDGA